jgi:aspartate ammonia-lyase
VVTALAPMIGYERATTIAREALQTGRTVRELVLEHGWLDAESIDAAFTPAALTRPWRRPRLV